MRNVRKTLSKIFPWLSSPEEAQERDEYESFLEDFKYLSTKLETGKIDEIANIYNNVITKESLSEIKKAKTVLNFNLNYGDYISIFVVKMINGELYLFAERFTPTYNKKIGAFQEISNYPDYKKYYSLFYKDGKFIPFSRRCQFK